MTWRRWVPLAAAGLVARLACGSGSSGGCGLGEARGACCADCESLLQISQSVGTAEEPERLDQEGHGNLCALASGGRLAREVALFLKGVADNDALAARLASEWVAVCGGARGASDAGLINALRKVVVGFADASGTRGDSEPQDEAPVAPNVTEAEARQLEEQQQKEACQSLEQELKDLGLTTSTRVLDYGCGGGDTLGSFGRCGFGKDNVGVDVQDARKDLNKHFFKFVQLSPPYAVDLGQKIASERLAGEFGFVTSDRVFHHVGSEADIRATARQLGKAIAPCGAFVLQDWDNPGKGKPDLTPFYDLTHTFWSTMCLPYSKQRAEKCRGDIPDAELHEMWEGARTVYLSQAKYREIMESEAGLTFSQGRTFAEQDARQADPQLLQMIQTGMSTKLRVRSNLSAAARGVDDTDWGHILHPFMHVYKKAC